MTRTFLLVALGGALGSSARALVGLLLPFPWATLAVNVAGGLMMGWLFALLGAGTALGALLMTGVLGGFTTFSAFSLDTLRLVEAGRTAQAGLYVLASVGLSILACRAGMMLGRLA